MPIYFSKSNFSIPSLRSVTLSHIKECSKKNTLESGSQVDEEMECSSSQEDYFWNYKCGEFFFDSLFKLMLIFEHYGHGLGMYILSKLLLPTLHFLGHSNYSNTIHRFICRVLINTTPQEAELLIWERFSNRSGKPGGNIFKDRRVEFRIRILKKLLKNLGHNLNSANIKKVNDIIDIKEEFYYHARKVNGVKIRRGAHKKRSDSKDYETLIESLKKMDAHLVIPGRQFGTIQYPENILDAAIFSKAVFYRWLTTKNKDAIKAYRSSHAADALPSFCS